MKRILSTSLFIVLLPTAVFSQQHISYAYDASGNRTQRQTAIQQNSLVFHQTGKNMKNLCMFIVLLFLLTSCIYEHFYYLEGNIIDKETKMPVRNVHVEADWMKTVRSDSSGYFLLVGHSKNYGVSFSKEGYREFVF